MGRVLKGEGLDGIGKPELKGDDRSTTGFSVQSSASFCSARMLTGCFSKTAMKLWSSCILSEGSRPFRGVPCWTTS